MTIDTYNVNGIDGRLEILLRWLKEDKPDVVCLQQLKSTSFPQTQIYRSG
jgi:exodeoxyribonuclease-3